MDAPDFSGIEEFADLSLLSGLSKIKGLESLNELKKLSELKDKGGAGSVSDIFGQLTSVKPEYKNKKGDILIAYEEHYMKLLRNYKNEIFDIELMMKQLRNEREEFYQIKLPEIERAINDDQVLDIGAKQKWISELRSNMEKSFAISESLISHYVTKNLEEFKRKLQSEINKV